MSFVPQFWLARWVVFALSWLGVSGLIASCKPSAPMCSRVVGQWKGHAVEGGDPSSAALFASILTSVRWTITSSSITSETGRVEPIRVVHSDANVCRVELTNAANGTRRLREMTLSDDGLLHANTVNEPVRIVLRRVGE